MDLCFSALIILAMGVINTSMDISIFGINIAMIIVDILFSILLVLFANWLCSVNWYVLSWFLSIAIAAITFLSLHLYRIRDPDFMVGINNIKKSKAATIKTHSPVSGNVSVSPAVHSNSIVKR